MSNQALTIGELHKMPKPKRRTIRAAVAHRMTAQEGAAAGERKAASEFFTVTLPIPPSLNNAYKNVRHGRVLSEAAKDYKFRAKEEIAWTLAIQKFKAPADARFALSLKLYFSSSHRRDVSNCVKLPEDSLAEVLGFDDSRVDRLLVERGGIDKQNPRCEITLEVL